MSPVFETIATSSRPADESWSIASASVVVMGAFPTRATLRTPMPCLNSLRRTILVIARSVSSMPKLAISEYRAISLVGNSDVLVKKPKVIISMMPKTAARSMRPDSRNG